MDVLMRVSVPQTRDGSSPREAAAKRTVGSRGRVCSCGRSCSTPNLVHPNLFVHSAVSASLLHYPPAPQPPHRLSTGHSPPLVPLQPSSPPQSWDPGPCSTLVLNSRISAQSHYTAPPILQNLPSHKLFVDGVGSSSSSYFLLRVND
jgi:hypothetical protein